MDLIWLDNPRALERAQVGIKAATLSILRQAGLLVPDGFCIPLVIANQITDEFWFNVADAYHRLTPTGGLVAVRSSGVAEDSAEASFAGQYDTILNVQDFNALRLAVERCWQSVHSTRAQAYRAKQGGGDSWLSVLIQQQAPASVSGVLFTIDPLSGSDELMVIEAVSGLGEGLVSGHIAPVQYRIDRQGHIQTESPQNLLNVTQCQTLAKLGLQIEHILGRGQDIEWALAENQFYIVQARPITRGAVSISLTDVWTRANIGEVLPNVITPLTWAVFRATLLNKPALVWDSQAEDIGEGIRRIYGRAYLRLDGLLNSFCYLPTVTPQVMSRVLGVNLPAAAHTYVRPTGLLVRLAQGIFVLDALGILPRLAWLVKQLSPLPAGADSPKLEELITWTSTTFRLHLKCTAYAIGAFGVLAYCLKRWLPAEVETLLPKLLIGHEDLQTAAQGVALWQLAEQVQTNTSLRTLLNSPLDWSTISSQVVQVAGGLEFLQTFQAFLRQNGARAAGEFELSAPRWREDPSFVLGVLLKYVDSQQSGIVQNFTARRQDQQEVLAYVKTVLRPWQGKLLSRLVSSYSHYTTLRENIKYRLMEDYALLRQTFLAIGANLTNQGLLANPHEVFLLTPADIKTLKDKPAQEALTLIRTRRAQLAHWEAQTAPALIIGEGQEITTSQANKLQGIGCSPGVAEGFARLLFDLAEADKLKPGEILVAPHTDPGWTPLFLSCRAVVTEIGGFLSHGATVAREYGIPAVVNVSGVTAQIHTGDFIRVDGTNGLITICNQINGGVNG